MNFPETPYELVLYLLDRKNLSLTSKNLTEILRDFWFEIENRPINAELIGDFLVAFSKLLVLKVDYLLGVLEEQPEILVDLKKYKLLQNIKRKFRRVVKRGPVYFSRRFVEVYGFIPPERLDISELQKSLEFIFFEKKEVEQEEILENRVSLEEAFQILQTVLTNEKEIILQERFQDKDILLALFLAILNWFKEGKLELEQNEIFGKIKIKPRNEENNFEN